MKAKESMEQISVKCSSCGYNLVYSVKRRMLYCKHCKSTVNIDADGITFKDIANIYSETNLWLDGTKDYRCPNCGASGVMDASSISQECHFCGTPVVLDDSQIPGTKPDSVVPFGVTKKEAIQDVAAWAKRSLYAPRKFKKEADPKDVSALYVPTYVFNTNTFTVYSGVLEETETYTVTNSDGSTSTETRTYTTVINGEYEYFFKEVSIEASSDSILQNYMHEMGHFNVSQSKAYKKEFLLGCSARQKSKEGAMCWEEASIEIEKRIKNQVLSKYSYSQVISFCANTTYSGTTYIYTLLPIYIGRTIYKMKNFNFFINGVSGKVVGKTPISGWKIFFTFLAFITFVPAIILFVVLSIKLRKNAALENKQQQFRIKQGQ